MYCWSLWSDSRPRSMRRLCLWSVRRCYLYQFRQTGEFYHFSINLQFGFLTLWPLVQELRITRESLPRWTDLLVVKQRWKMY